jgi:hypothetical protein
MYKEPVYECERKAALLDEAVALLRVEPFWRYVLASSASPALLAEIEKNRFPRRNSGVYDDDETGRLERLRTPQRPTERTE